MSTTPPTDATDGPGDAPPAARPRRRRRGLTRSELRSWLQLAALATVAVGLCWALISIDFAIVAAFVIGAALLYRADPGRPVAFGGFIVLVGAALATVLEVAPTSGDPTLTFASNRPFAGNAGNVAGALLAVAVVLFAIVERSPRPAPHWTAARPLGGWSGTARRWLVHEPRVRVVQAGIGVVALGVRVVAAPPPLSPAVQQITRNLRSGTGYLGVVDGQAVVVTDHPPLAPLVGAFAPGGPRLVQVLVGVLGVALVWRLARRIGRAPEPAVLAAVVAAVAPALWDQQLPVVLAGTLVVGAVLLADPDRLDGRRAVAAGLALAAAGVARPDALVAVPILVAWVLLRRRDGVGTTEGDGPRHKAAWVLAAPLAVLPAVALVPWVRFVTSTGALPLPTGSFGALVAEPGAGGRLPTLVGAGAGVLLVVAALVAVGRDVESWRGDARWWLPVLALPAVAAALGVLAGGQAGILGWGAPLATVVVGLGFADLVPSVADPTPAGPDLTDPDLTGPVVDRA